MCCQCRVGKVQKLLFFCKFDRATFVSDIVHSDILGPLLLSYSDRFQYASGFIDEQSTYAKVGFMVNRSEFAPVYIAGAENLQQIGPDRFAKMRSDTSEKYIVLQ